MHEVALGLTVGGQRKRSGHGVGELRMTDDTGDVATLVLSLGDHQHRLHRENHPRLEDRVHILTQLESRLSETRRK